MIYTAPWEGAAFPALECHHLFSPTIHVLVSGVTYGNNVQQCTNPALNLQPPFTPCKHVL